MNEDKLKESVEKWIGKWKLGGDSSFYTPKQWQEKGEEIGAYADLTLVCEGSLNHVLNGYASDSNHLIDDFNRVVNEAGYWWEWGFSWSVHFYKKDN
jgi:hypothetical protein